MSGRYGWDRGVPVDRYYIDSFIRRSASAIRGEVLEVKDSTYTRRFGGSQVTGSHVVDIDPGNPRATLVADLSAPRSLPAEAYDCVILTQTLQYLADDARAMENIWRALRGGGVLLVTAPCLGRIDEEPLRVSDFWRYTPAGLHRRLLSSCPGGEIEVCGPGNVLSCTAYLFGLAVEDLTDAELAVSDWRFPIVACARVVKPAHRPCPAPSALSPPNSTARG